jgi:hypothetical protein
MLRPLLPEVSVYRPTFLDRGGNSQSNSSSSPSSKRKALSSSNEGKSPHEGEAEEEEDLLLAGLTEEERQKLWLELHPPTPGLKYRHYSPDAQVVLFVPTGSETQEDELTGEGLARMNSQLGQRLAEALREGQKVGVIQLYPGLEEWTEGPVPVTVIHSVSTTTATTTTNPLGSSENSEEEGNLKGSLLMWRTEPNAGRVARELFGALRGLDEAGAGLIFVEGLPEVGLGLAVMNRLRKASSLIVPC